MMQGLQHTDCMQEERLSTQATQAVKLYITSNRDLEDLDTQALNELPVWIAASGFVKAVKKHPALSFEDHALFPLWVLLLGEGPNLRFHNKAMTAPHVIEAHKYFVATLVQKFVFDKRLGANSWERDCDAAVDFWSIYLSHLLTICVSEGHINNDFRAQYRAGLKPWHIRVPDDMKLNTGRRLPDGRRYRSKLNQKTSKGGHQVGRWITITRKTTKPNLTLTTDTAEGSHRYHRDTRRHNGEVQDTWMTRIRRGWLRRRKQQAP